MKTSHHECARPGRMYRDKENGMIMGVCAGLADFFAFQTGIVRIIAIVLLFVFTTATIITYVALAFLLRPKPLCYHGHDDERSFWKRHRRSDYRSHY